MTLIKCVKVPNFGIEFFFAFVPSKIVVIFQQVKMTCYLKIDFFILIDVK